MKFLIFIKQVPDSTEIRFDAGKKTIIREGVKNVINPYDRRTISEAIRRREEAGGEVIVATMGPPQAVEVLKEAVVMGVDLAFHIEDPAFAGSDTLVTSHVLAAAARKIGFDLLMCGLHSTDSETGQVPPELGELLGIPCAVGVRKMEYLPEMIRVHCETDEGFSVLEMPLPAIVSTAERLIKPIKTKDVDLSAVPLNRIVSLSLEELRLSPAQVGFTASPTWVDEIEDESVLRDPELWDGADASMSARRILERIRVTMKRPAPPSVPVSFVKGERDSWCWIERNANEIRKVSLEMLGSAATQSARMGGMVSAVIVGAPPPTVTEKEELSRFGADRIFYAHSASPHPDEIVSLVCEKIVNLHPYAFLFPATSSGKYLAPRIAARLRLGLTGDCVGLETDSSGKLAHLKPAFGGTIIARIYSKTLPQLVTVRPGALPMLHPRTASEIPVDSWSFPYNVPHQFRVISHETDTGSEASRLDSAQIVICIGMGLGKENVSSAFQLADLLEGAVGATRRVVDSGWLPRQFQIGLTGKFLVPETYLGLGVSGRYNHTIGIQKAGTIIAINSDPNAEIFQTADIGVMGDCKEILTAMIRILESS